MKTRDSVYDGRRGNPLNVEVIRIFQIFTLYIWYWRAERARKNYQNKKKNNLWTPSPTHQTSTQDPTSDKSQGGPDPRFPPPPSGSAHAALCDVLSIWWRPILNCAVYRYRNGIGNHMIRFTVWQKTVHTSFRQVNLITEWDLQIFDFESQETNRTKILRKLWFARLQIGVEGNKGDKGTFTYPPAFFLLLVFENSSQRFTKYSTVTFGFDPWAILPSG